MRGMGKEEDAQLKAAKKGYRDAAAAGNHEEEARWANVIGDILKKRGEYVEALRWLRIDYDVSVKFLPQKQLLPTCQSLGEVYLRLNQFKEALIYQKKHFELAKESDDLIEQQRASTQLGRTYHEIFLRSEDDHNAVRNAKKYFKAAMKLARTLKENNSGLESYLFLKEFIDAHNNIGMLELDLDNLDEAEKILLKGLKICDEEEVVENDDGRSRLHHNLGSVYLELREWSKAKEHIERDILICKRIGHPQGEAKGFINLAELHYRAQKYDEAIKCYQKALDIAKVMEDEDTLIDQINQNITTVKQAMGVFEELKKEEQNLKKLTRATCNARGTAQERKYLLEQNASLDRLIEKSRMIFAWKKHQEFAKRKKRVTSELCDKEKLSDSYLAIGESYQKLRNFSKARKWYMKSWNTYRSIGNLEGQALAKINIGEVLDSSGDWAGALEAFEEGYRIAVQGNLPSVQLSALDNMHYSHMIRFDNMEDARKLQHEIQTLKHLLNEEDELKIAGNDYCSETETEGLDMSDDVSDECDPGMRRTDTSRPKPINDIEVLDEDVPLASLFRSSKNSSKTKTKKSDLISCGKKSSISGNMFEASPKDSKSFSNQSIGRKRVRVVISDDEADDHDNLDEARGRPHCNSVEDVATSNGGNPRNELPNLANIVEDVTCPGVFKDVLSTCTPIHLEESTCSLKSNFLKDSAKKSTEFGYLSDAEDANTPKSMASESRMDCHRALGSQQQKQDTNIITFKVGCDLIHVDTSPFMDGDKLSAELLEIEVACQYYLQLPNEKRSKGLLPVFEKLKFSGKDLDLLEAFVDLNDSVFPDSFMEVIVDEWIPKRLMKMYIDCCEKKSEKPNMKLLKKLYTLEVSEDEIVVSDCGLQDISISPFLDALYEHKTIALLDISHNVLGNETMERLQKMFASSSQTYGSLTLDLHCNRFGPTSLFQICECPVLLARLEVLNLSENRLTDACSSYLSTILINCKALYSLSIEKCCVTSRTIQRITDVLDERHVLSHLNIGKNNPVSGSCMVNLLTKLAKLKRFSELCLNGIKLGKLAVESICQLARSSSLSSLILGGTCIGADGAIQVTEALSSGPQELVKLDLSYCGITTQDFTKVCANIALASGLLELNLGGNDFGKEGCHALASFLMHSQCSLRVLVLNKNQLGLTGIVQIIQALGENESLEELHVAGNADMVEEASLQSDPPVQDASKLSCQPEQCTVSFDCMNMEVADSEDELSKEELIASLPNGSCTSSSRRNPFQGSCVMQELSVAIASSRQLLLLDLSGNGLSTEAVETLYTAWSSRSGVSAQKHVKEQIVHFSMEGKRCCGIKACCRRDGAV